MSKYIYFFGNGSAEGQGSMRALLGGKGANLAEIVDRLRHMMQWSGEVLTRLQELELEALLARSQSAIGQAPSDLPPPV